jgi:hypothetical protein
MQQFAANQLYISSLGYPRKDHHFTLSYPILPMLPILPI